MDCDVCHDESDGIYVGVAAVPGVPLSVGWCSFCLRENAVPRAVVESWLFGGEETLPADPPDCGLFAEWAQSMSVWIDGSYVKLCDAIPLLWVDETATRKKLGEGFGTVPMGINQVAAVAARKRVALMADIDVEQPDALALRCLQAADELTSFDDRVGLLALQDELGRKLGLECSGVPEGAGFYDHSGGTCPIHEWLVPNDHDQLTAHVL